MEPIKVVVADDNSNFLDTLTWMLEGFKTFQVVIKAENGKELLEKMQTCALPIDIAILDIKMPVMDGIETASQLSYKHPQIKILGLSADDNDVAILRMVKNGACSFLLKETHPDIFERALLSINEDGCYRGDLLYTNYEHFVTLNHLEPVITKHEKRFLEWAADNKNDSEIANLMGVSLSTIAGYETNLLMKLHAKNRLMLVLSAVKRAIVVLNKES